MLSVESADSDTVNVISLSDNEALRSLFFLLKIKVITMSDKQKKEPEKKQPEPTQETPRRPDYQRLGLGSFGSRYRRGW